MSGTLREPTFRHRMVSPTLRAMSERLPVQVAAAVYELVTGSLSENSHRVGRQLDPPLGEQPEVRCINFTGSSATGRLLAESRQADLKRCVLELGGVQPADRAGRRRPGLCRGSGGFRGVFPPGADLHVGQEGARRAAGLRLVRGAAGRARRRPPVGDPAVAGTVIGPLINRTALERVARQVSEAVQAGARLLAGGRTGGPCYGGPFADVPERHPRTDSRLCRATGRFLNFLPVRGQLASWFSLLSDDGFGGFAGGCLQGPGVLVVGEGDLAVAQAPDRLGDAGRVGHVDPGSGAPPSAPGGLCPREQQVQGRQVRQDAILADVGVSPGPGLVWQRCCDRGGTGRRLSRWTRLIPSAVPAARKARAGR